MRVPITYTPRRFRRLLSAGATREDIILPPLAEQIKNEPVDIQSLWDIYSEEIPQSCLGKLRSHVPEKTEDVQTDPSAIPQGFRQCQAFGVRDEGVRV